VLSSNADEIIYGRIIAPLNISAQKLRALRETNRIETVLKFRITLEQIASIIDLVIHIHKEAIEFVCFGRIANAGGVDILIRVIIDQGADSAHGEGVAARISHTVPENSRKTRLVHNASTTHISSAMRLRRSRQGKCDNNYD